MPTPPKEPVPPVVWDVIPDLYKTIITSAGPNLNPMHFQMVLGFIYRLRHHKALEPRKHNPKSPEVLEAWLKETPLVLTDLPVSSLANSLVCSLKELVPGYRPAPLPVMPPAPRLDGIPTPAPAIAPLPTTAEGPANEFPLEYEIEESVHGTSTYSRTDSIPCEGTVDLAHLAGLSDRDIQANLRDYARANWGDEAGDRHYGDSETGDDNDDESEVESIHLNNLDALIAAVREYERSHA